MLYCDETTGAPCKLRTSKKDTLVAPPPDYNCSTGVMSPTGAGVDISCAAQCGVCGGAGCGGRPGESGNCCHQSIPDAGLYCDETGGPRCIMRPFNDNVLPGYAYHKAAQCKGYANADSTKRSRLASTVACESNSSCQAISCPARSREGCTLRAALPEDWQYYGPMTCNADGATATHAQAPNSRWGVSLQDCKEACAIATSNRFMEWHQGPGNQHYCACYDDCTPTTDSGPSLYGPTNLTVELYTLGDYTPFHAEDCYIRDADCAVGAWQPPHETTCKDGVKNGDETGLDCGGTCFACDPGLSTTADMANAMLSSTGAVAIAMTPKFYTSTLDDGRRTSGSSDPCPLRTLGVHDEDHRRPWRRELRGRRRRHPPPAQFLQILLHRRHVHRLRS